VNLTPEQRRLLRSELDLAVRRREQATAAERWFERRLSEGRPLTFNICAATVFSVGGIDHRCSKRAESGSAFCRFHSRAADSRSRTDT
jgi:hypothetical protein